MDQWTDWTATTFQPAWIGLSLLKVRTPVTQQDAAAIGKALSTTVRCFRMLEAWLTEAPYLGTTT